MYSLFFLWCSYMPNKNYTPNLFFGAIQLISCVLFREVDMHRHVTKKAIGINSIQFMLLWSTCWCNSIIHVMACFCFTYLLSSKCYINSVLWWRVAISNNQQSGSAEETWGQNSAVVVTRNSIMQVVYHLGGQEKDPSSKAYIGGKGRNAYFAPSLFHNLGVVEHGMVLSSSGTAACGWLYKRTV